jgi:stage II sporulation protein AA (anti-sigma F factor antagonist)
MELKVSTEQGRVPITLVHVDGDIDASTAQEFQSRMEALIQGGTRDILIDLAHVPYISSAGLRALQTVFSQLRALSPDVSDAEMRRGVSAGTYMSPHLKLANMTANAENAFKMAGFDMFIEVYKSIDEAVASF